MGASINLGSRLKTFVGASHAFRTDRDGIQSNVDCGLRPTATVRCGVQWLTSPHRYSFASASNLNIHQ